jgi:DNA-binding protein YbaB
MDNVVSQTWSLSTVKDLKSLQELVTPAFKEAAFKTERHHNQSHGLDK